MMVKCADSTIQVYCKLFLVKLVLPINHFCHLVKAKVNHFYLDIPWSRFPAVINQLLLFCPIIQDFNVGQTKSGN